MNEFDPQWENSYVTETKWYMNKVTQELEATTETLNRGPEDFESGSRLPVLTDHAKNIRGHMDQLLRELDFGNGGQQ